MSPLHLHRCLLVGAAFLFAPTHAEVGSGAAAATTAAASPTFTYQKMQLFPPNTTPVLSPISMPVEYKREMMLQVFFGGNHQNQLIDSMYGLDSKRAQKTLALGVVEVWRWFSLEWRKQEWPLPRRNCAREVNISTGKEAFKETLS